MKGSTKDVRKERIQRRHFQVARARPKGILEIIHSNVCRPMSSSSLSEYVYYVSFIDEFFRKTWIYFMKNKDEVFSKFNEFKDLCKESGIKRDFSTPYNPQKNGVAKRKTQKRD